MHFPVCLTSLLSLSVPIFISSRTHICLTAIQFNRFCRKEWRATWSVNPPPNAHFLMFLWYPRKQKAFLAKHKNAWECCETNEQSYERRVSKDVLRCWVRLLYKHGQGCELQTSLLSLPRAAYRVLSMPSGCIISVWWFCNKHMVTVKLSRSRMTVQKKKRK